MHVKMNEDLVFLSEQWTKQGATIDEKLSCLREMVRNMEAELKEVDDLEAADDDEFDNMPV